MTTLFSSHTTLMRRGALFRLQGAPGLRIAGVRGVLWVTQQGDTRDWVLAAGESLVLERSGTVLVNALADDAAFSGAHGTQSRYHNGVRAPQGHEPQPAAATITHIGPRYDVATLAGRTPGERRALVEAEARWMRAQVMARLMSRAAGAIRGAWRRYVAQPLAALLGAIVR